MAGANFKPTAEQRSLVKSLAMIGIPRTHIATVLGRSRGVLERHFAKELGQGYGQALARVATVAHEMAKSGKYPSVSRFWTETVGRSLTNIVMEEGEGSFKMRFRRKQPPEDGQPYQIDRKGYYVTGDLKAEPRRSKLPEISAPDDSNSDLNDDMLMSSEQEK
jgi:hypothetical protein